MTLLQILPTLILWIVVFVIVGGIALLSFVINRKFKKLKEEKIRESWSILIDGANGEGEKVLTGFIREIERVEAPYVHVTRKEVKPGRGFIKKSREFLIVEHKVFDTYDMYIGARDYGKQLFVTWYLVEEPFSFLRLFKRNLIGAFWKLPFIFFGMFFGGGFASASNLFDSEELTAYALTTHHAVLASVKELMENRNIDFSKVDTKTRGFLNLS